MSRVADYSGLPDCIIQYSEHVSEITEDGVKTTDGKELKEVGTIVFCTGYNMKVRGSLDKCLYGVKCQF